MTSTEMRTEAEDSGPSGYAAARLRLLQEGAQSGPPRRAALAELTDEWLTGLFGAGAEGLRGVSLVAVGGYGRGELSPRSDLDLLLLHDGADSGTVAALADRIWYPIWDLGLALDHSVRTPGEARKTAGGDLKVQLGLLDARHIAGDLGLTAGLRTAILADWRNQAPKRLPELQELCAERAERQGELQYLLEPDLKEARGGLRDATALRAVAASWLADAPREGLADARRRLLDVRDALHLTTGRATDRLALQEQDQVAAELGLLDADTLLRQVYEAARVVSYASDVTWREVGRVLKSRAVRPRLRAMLGGGAKPAVERSPLAEGVVEMDGEVVLARAARPERDPVLPLRAAAAAAQAGLPLSLHAVRRMAAVARPLPTPWPAEAREQLVTLLGSGRPTIEVWEALEAEGLITRLLPDWERVRCRPQRNAVHIWTVDRHLIETAVRASELARRVGRPDLLLVSALLHDIGKGWPGDHSVAGEIIARDVAARIGFDRADVAVLATLVRHHLLLIDTATRRDLEDPATVRSVAEAVGSQSTLELLHALTEADALATGPAAWSSWRGSLVADLVKRVAAVLAGGAPEEPEAAAPTAEQERLAIEAFRTGGPVLALRAQTEPPTEEEPTGDPEPLGVELLIAVPDQPGVLPAVAGVLAMHRLTVRTAELRALDLPDGVEGSVLLLNWRVAAEYGSLPQAARLRADLVRSLDGSLDIAARLAERDAAYPRRRGTIAPPPRVTVASAASRHATVIEVRAHDAPGLLHRIGRALEDASVWVRSMHVSTLGANAVDAFYVTGPKGAPLPAEEAVSVARGLEEMLRG
ncbi:MULTISPECIES: [protein-PII] uridylyltransferase [Streptomyces]|uniref:Bifunctional uridylyltransferase/uridylyl-removing enzyme n=4 Tax=Streptomyces mirabilis TaxID=68239 RepID=A0ABU3UJW1_9ACTN|nr:MULTISPECIES: [protein-PII] uridylyltransferase [Streptomyces]KPI03338.1 UTP-GlnB uridylyltransferase, GlnD / adenyl transferase, GlnE [Actinobacteria bacterium OK006]KAF5994558.1 [protein-PII] uridylyltransferase [Streptomyces sp. WAC00263]MCX4421126.1 [protein-PII] uridylyltransferase [Streptomyces mirabilis]MCX4612081.1 [protein-PII] uridylyltransferase [Streptomyces mirabilis]MCX5352328.1 [protein-PII] uridylyltransferase [Streptomyces mirabilis]